VETHPLALALDDRAPTTALGGKFSVPHVVASVLVTGSTDAAVFDAAGLDDPAVAAVRDRVRLAPFEPLPEAPHDRPARVSVTASDGRVHTSTCLSAVGGPDRPLGALQVVEKARVLTESRIPGFADRAEALVSGATRGDQSWASTLSDLLAR
jgi:2-methylcitrate dehydratase PrpD